jgi:proline dehydrogenase
LFLFLARQEGFKNLALKFKFFRDTAARFIAGETLDDAIRAVRQANEQKMLGTLDLLGENTLSREDASRASQEVIGILDRIQAEKVNCNVSVKLTQLGLALDPEFCEQNLNRIIEHSGRRSNFIRVDMEDSQYTQQTLDMVVRTHRRLGNVGTVIQSYLYRSEEDTIRLLKASIRIRLVKGAYRESESIAFRKKKDTDANFVKLMKMLLDSDTYGAIATHDEVQFERPRNLPVPEAFQRIILNFSCCMEYGATFRYSLPGRATTSGSTFPMAGSGILIT